MSQMRLPAGCIHGTGQAGLRDGSIGLRSPRLFDTPWGNTVLPPVAVSLGAGHGSWGEKGAAFEDNTGVSALRLLLFHTLVCLFCVQVISAIRLDSGAPSSEQLAFWVTATHPLSW